ncbi:23S rRNA pseudouridine(955/2504/2580) synthase [Bertholletia excelsa]
MARSVRVLRRALCRPLPLAALTGGAIASSLASHGRETQYTTVSGDNEVIESKDDKRKGHWFTLPPFNSPVDCAKLGRELSGRRPERKGDADADWSGTNMTALKWVLRCCPQLPRSLVQKLFRLRQVRRESSIIKTGTDLGVESHKPQFRRVTAKDSMNVGDRLFLPITVKEFPSEKPERLHDEEEMNFLRMFELYKDLAIIVVNKPPGMPVQGGVGIKKSLDELAGAYLRYEFEEPPRLVHRLDRDSSGILVMGRTQTSTRVLHAIFREKTTGASNDVLHKRDRVLQRRYWALVIGCPRRSKGLISMPLKKVIVDGGKSERITVADNSQVLSSQHAITEYRVIGSSSHGYTWLELSPLTGRKHQLRVHCAEVLGTPIVGDCKYGWQAHSKMKHLPCSDLEGKLNGERPQEMRLPFGLDLNKGSILEPHPHLHLHCKEMVLPNVARALDHGHFSTSYDLSCLDGLNLAAPLPSHMQKSWNFLNS